MAKGNTVSSNDDWQVEDDLRTLCRAKEIENDPKRSEACRKMAQKRMMEMASIASEDKE